MLRPTPIPSIYKVLIYSRGERETWVHSKYVERKYVGRHSTTSSEHRLRRRSVRKKLSDGKLRSFSFERREGESEETPSLKSDGGSDEPVLHPNMVRYFLQATWLSRLSNSFSNCRASDWSLFSDNFR